MTDFLTRLAERTLGLAPTAKPIIPSMFAQGPAILGEYPSGLLNGKSRGIVFNETQVVPSQLPLMLPPLEARGEPSHPKSSDHQSTLRHHPDSASLEQVKAEVSSVDVPAPDKNQSAMSVQGNQRALTPTSRLIYPEDSPSGKLSPELISVSAEPIEVKMLSERGRGDSPLSALAAETQTGMSKPTLDSPTLSPPLLAVTEEQPATESTWKSSAILIRPRVNHYQERIEGTSPEQSASVPESPTPPPTIRVTIGRVEVRAITPPVPQALRTTPTPVLSLDDYLKQRNEG